MSEVRNPTKPVNQANASSSTGTVKVLSSDRLLVDEIVSCLQTAFNCTVTSKKMYSTEKDAFFLYAEVERRP